MPRCDDDISTSGVIRARESPQDCGSIPRPFRHGACVGDAVLGMKPDVRATGMRLRLRRTAAGILVSVAGCGVSPSVNILGSFFPAWLISIIVGIVLTVVVRRVLVAIDVAAHLEPAPLVYPCLVGLLTLATWLVVFGN